MGLDMQTIVAAAPPMHRAHKDDRLSSVLVHGLMKTPGSLVQEKSEAGRAPGIDLLSFHVVLQITRKADGESTLTAGSRNRLNTETRRQERCPVFFEQMVNKKWEMKEMASLEEKKWEGHGCSEEAVVHTRAKYSHMVWMKTKPEHMVLAEEDTTKGKNTWKRSTKET